MKVYHAILEGPKLRFSIYTIIILPDIFYFQFSEVHGIITRKLAEGQFSLSKKVAIGGLFLV